MVCEAYGSPRVLRENARKELGKGEVRIKTEYAGFNMLVELWSIGKVDLLACEGKYQEKSRPPFIPGLEVCGCVIEKNGACAVDVGDRVYCLFSGSGGYSEECVIDGNRCFRIPEVRNESV